MAQNAYKTMRGDKKTVRRPSALAMFFYTVAYGHIGARLVLWSYFQRGERLAACTARRRAMLNKLIEKLNVIV